MKRIIIFMKRTYFNWLAGRKVNQAILPVSNSPFSTDEKREKPQGISDVLDKVESYLNEQYEFRYNQLTETTEFRAHNTAGCRFQIVGQRELNSLCIDMRRKGIDCWDRDISRYIHSDKISIYHPFTTYMNFLPEWDGINRIEPLAQRVSENSTWVNGFHRWMLGMAAQWMGIDSLHANSVAPVLISRKQGMHKSTFCKLLLPEELQGYYTDSYNLTTQSAAEQKLTVFGLINMDEFDKFSEKKMALLKNLIQMPCVNMRKAYKKNFTPLPRIASFIATSNRVDLLTDPTGSRRFLCVEVSNKIDVSAIEHAQIYAQLKAELAKGKRYWFNSEEEKEVTLNNLSFQKAGLEEDLFLHYFRIPQSDEKGELLSAAYMYEMLREKHPAIMRTTSAQNFGRTLIRLGLQKRHTKQGNVYPIIPLFTRVNPGEPS